MYLCDGVFDYFLIAHIGFVSHEKLVYAFGSITVDFLKPLFDVVE
jgi:hypothetical protein